MADDEDMMAEAAWSARVEDALRQRASGRVRPISEMLDEVEADE